MWLVTGGAGYIGSHVVRSLRFGGEDVMVLDDLSTGYAERLDPDVRLIRGSLVNAAALRNVFMTHDFEGVIHFAAKKSVEESVARPEFYTEQNVFGMENLLAAMRAGGVKKMIFSSSAAVYGEPAWSPVSESDPTLPVNPYGATKLIGEELLESAGSEWGLSSVALRYFNVAGTGAPELVDRGETNLIPLVLRAIRENRSPVVFGDDYDTPDGSCVRDFIHVTDLAQAHIDAIEGLESAEMRVFNVGTGTGFTVREVITRALEITDSKVRYKVLARRPGDPASVVASTEKIGSALAWKPMFSLDDMISSAWNARRN